MTRREFPRSVRVAVIKRTTVNGQVMCEECGLPAKKFQIDHVRPDGLLGEPVLENAKLICERCYKVKNPEDTSKIAQAKRREAAHIGARAQPSQPIQSAGFPPIDKSTKKTALRQPGKLDGLGPSNLARLFKSI